VKEVVLPKNVLSKFINGVEASRCFEDDGPINITLDTTASEYSYLWSTGETAASIEVNGGGVFKVVLSEDKCAVSDEVKIIDYCPTSFFVPNAFTPNGDGTNNQFLAVGSNVKDFEMLIFNRWGEQIFRSTDIGTGWDGKYNSHLVQEDVYVYKILYSVNNESGVLSKKERIGSIAVIY
jgi:gliding motility-associated-like protein